MRILRSAAAVLLVVTLAGCSSAASTPTASPVPATEPAPSPDAPQPVASIVIGGSEFTTVLADGSVRDTVPFSSDPAEAVALLSDLFGADPVVATTEEAHCAPSVTNADWDGAVTLGRDFAWLPEGQLFHLLVKTPSYAGIDFDTTVGLGVGDDAAEFVATVPADQVALHDDTTVLGSAPYAVEGGEFAGAYDAWGGQLLTRGTVVGGIMSPIAYLAFTTC